MSVLQNVISTETFLKSNMLEKKLLLNFTLFILIVFFFNEISGIHIPRKVPKFFIPKNVKDFLERKELIKMDSSQENGEIKKIEEKVKFQFFNKLIPEGVFLNDTKHLKSIKFIDNQPTKFITNGWLSSGKDDVCQSIKDQYLSHGNFNIFIVHWDSIAMSYLYLFVIQKLKFVANYYAKFVEELISTKSIDPEKIHLIGHSLGAHLSGMVGQRLRTKRNPIGRVTGLDPDQYYGEEKLSQGNAKFVDVIHSNGGCGCTSGKIFPIGHVDFYPNGGHYPMPGCDNFWSQKQCSHNRSWQYFAESITNPFIAVLCDSLNSFRNGFCSNQTIELGNNISTDARGSYFFSTSSSSPYSIGENGTTYIPRTHENSTLLSGCPLEELFSFQFGCGELNVDSNENL